MKKLNLLFLLGLLMFSACKKEDKAPSTQPTTPAPVQTATMPVYMTDVKLNYHFGGNAPMVRITESGTTNEFTFLISTCANPNGNTFTVVNGKSYNVVFGLFVNGTWAQLGGFNGTMTISNDGQISGVIGAGNETLSVTKASDFSGCGSVITGDIILFY